MTFLEKQLEDRKKELAKLYNPKKSFGDGKILELIERIQADEQYLATHKICPDCAGAGTQPHECDCEKCFTDYEDCEECFGDGYIDKD